MTFPERKGRMDEIGAYAFVTSDYKQKGYPFDLWVKWNSKFFDKLAVISYGELKIPHYDNVLIKTMPPPQEVNWKFYTDGEQNAQELLDTEWKAMLGIDEFVNRRIITESLDKSKVYALRFHHLYGNPVTEIVGAFPEYYFRVHTGIRRVLNDGGSVSGPREWGTLSLKNLARKYMNSSSGLSWTLKESLYLLKRDGLKRALFTPKYAGEIFHTNTLRDPRSLKLKWKEQTIRARNEGNSMQKHDILEEETLNKSESFDYNKYKKIWPHSFLKRLSTEDVPIIITENKGMFEWVNFDRIL